MATGAPGTNGVWQYGEDDSEATFSALLNKVASTTNTQIGADRTRLTALEAAGRILQTVSTTKTDTFSTSSTSFTALTGLSASITPKSASSKILVVCNINVASPTNQTAYFGLLRGATAIGRSTTATSQNATFFIADIAGSAMFNYASTVLDSPATTSSVTYSVEVKMTGGTSYINRRSNDNGFGGISSITLLEVAG
jgi:hypothetical protein